jgi:hypothetical protein
LFVSPFLLFCAKRAEAVSHFRDEKVRQFERREMPAGRKRLRRAQICGPILAKQLQGTELNSMLVLQVITVFLVAVALALSLAHALEFPGKMRLPKEAYLATQTIYYPGFTIGGFGEGLGLVATLLLLLLVPHGNPAFRWVLVAFLSLLAMHLVIWTVTQPVNRRWLADLNLSGPAQTFFSVRQGSHDNTAGDQWERLRNKWEYSHVVRAVLAAISLISLTIAVAIYGGS